MTENSVLLSSIDDIELYLLGNISKADIEYHFKATDNVGGLVSVLDGEGFGKAVSEDVVSVDKVPVNDGSGFNDFHSMRGNDEFQRDAQGVRSFGGTMYYNGGGLCHGGPPF